MCTFLHSGGVRKVLFPRGGGGKGGVSNFYSKKICGIEKKVYYIAESSLQTL